MPTLQEITLETKVSDLLQENENMINILLDINPNFKKLNKSVINKTLAHEDANLKEAAIVAGMKPSELVNSLRKKFNQETLQIEDEDGAQKAPG
jgi:DNA-binding NtrC family response regulator